MVNLWCKVWPSYRQYYCKSRIFHMRFSFVYVICGGLRTEIKCIRKVQSKSENPQWSAAVRKCHAYERSAIPKIQKFSAYEMFWIYSTEIAEIFVRVKISYSSVRELSYAINYRTAMMVSHTLLYVHGFRMLLNFVLSAESTKSTKLNRVRKFVRLQ